MTRPRDNRDPASLHRAWIGLLQPDGIVVSTAALVDAGLSPDPIAHGELDRLRALCGLAPEKPRDRDPVEAPRMFVAQALARLFVEVLGCDPEWIHGTTAQPFPEDRHGLKRVLTEFNGEELSPTFAIENPNRGTAHADRRWLCLLKELSSDYDLDKPQGDYTAAHWVASPMAKFERLLRETNVPIGVISNETELRLVFAPPGEGAGVMSFPVALLLGSESDMALGALVMLLGHARWLDGTPDGAATRDRDKQFLPHLLEESRKYQNTVSTALAEQVLDALWELLRGLQSAHAATQGALLRDWVNDRPDEIYGGLLAVLLRLVFLLYAEDRGQLPSVGFYAASYGVRSLYEKLRDDDGRHPDTMNLRLGAWARLLATFRLVHDGGGHGEVHLPAREGALFSPDTHAFLEGRPWGSHAQRGEALDVPAIPDGVVFKVLEKLLRVDREDLSYKTLGVEELGSVYESMMGFTVLTTTGHSLALKPDDVVVDLQALLALPGKERAKYLADKADATVAGKSQDALRTASTIEELADALAKSRSPRTPAIVQPGSLVLQPTAERRRSGSHYTPRTLTGPIVERTLRPVFTALGEAPTHEQILALKVCDPAMGSGAFLVAACRWLGDRLYEVWQRDGGSAKPVVVAKITPDDDERMVARRLVAQHCLYGVDKNPFAVNLARLSLWLETLAKEHPFTFLDHVLREGDSLVGVSRKQVQYLRLEPIAAEVQLETLPMSVFEGVKRAEANRAEIRELALSDDTAQKRRLLDESETSTAFLREVGDALVATFFAHTKEGERKKAMTALREGLLADKNAEVTLAAAKGLKLRPFHWELEFPEVFSRDNGGFDAIVGNPPFAGKNTNFASSGELYVYFLVDAFPEGHGSADLVAFFFRRSFSLLREGGTLGLIATNSIAQGDTRGTGLRWICNNGGKIYESRRNVRWPGTAAVSVSVVHIARTRDELPLVRLDDRVVSRVTAFLLPSGINDDPERIQANGGRCFVGSYVLGMGFLFDDREPTSTPISELHRLLDKNPRNGERVFPFQGGEQINADPRQAARRWVINFADFDYEKAQCWPDLLAIVESKVKPERERLGNNTDARRRKANWWRWGQYAHALQSALEGFDFVFACSQVSSHLAFVLQSARYIFGHTVVVVPSQGYCSFAVLQSSLHERWARVFGSTLEDRLRYTPSDCFDTFPFPLDWETDPALEAAGHAYHEFRAKLMIDNNEGLTATYNRFHSREDESLGIVQLRELHAAMDRAVLDAYGWYDLQPTCEFLLEFEVAEEDGRKKKPWRYRWPDTTRDEVLARLLELNGQRAAAERAEMALRAEAAAAKAAEEGRAAAEAKAAKTQGKNASASTATEKPKRPKRKKDEKQAADVVEEDKRLPGT